MKYYFIQYYLEEKLATDDDVREVIEQIQAKAKKMGMQAKWSIEGADVINAWGSDSSSFASKLGKIGGKVTLKKYGKDKMTEWGKKGGRPKKSVLESQAKSEVIS